MSGRRPLDGRNLVAFDSPSKFPQCRPEAPRPEIVQYLRGIWKPPSLGMEVPLAMQLSLKVETTSNQGTLFPRGFREG